MEHIDVMDLQTIEPGNVKVSAAAIILIKEAPCLIFGQRGLRKFGQCDK